MRNENRIFPMMNEMAYLWTENCPDWRFAQLMSNFFSWLGHDPFYIEDGDLMSEFRDFIDSLKKE